MTKLRILLYSITLGLFSAVGFSAQAEFITDFDADLRQANAQAVADSFLQQRTLADSSAGASVMSLTNESTDELGMQRSVFNQFHNGVPVFGGQVIVHVEEDASVQAMNGKVVSNITLDTTPTLSEDEAIANAKVLLEEEFEGVTPEVLNSKLYV